MTFERGVFARTALIAALALSLVLGFMPTVRPSGQVTADPSTFLP